MDPGSTPQNVKFHHRISVFHLQTPIVLDPSETTCVSKFGCPVLSNLLEKTGFPNVVICKMIFFTVSVYISEGVSLCCIRCCLPKRAYQPPMPKNASSEVSKVVSQDKLSRCFTRGFSKSFRGWRSNPVSQESFQRQFSNHSSHKWCPQRMFRTQVQDNFSRQFPQENCSIAFVPRELTPTQFAIPRTDFPNELPKIVPQQTKRIQREDV